MQKAKRELEEIREELVAWQSQYEAAQFKVDKVKSLNDSLKVIIFLNVCRSF